MKCLLSHKLLDDIMCGCSNLDILSYTHSLVIMLVLTSSDFREIHVKYSVFVKEYPIVKTLSILLCVPAVSLRRRIV